MINSVNFVYSCLKNRSSERRFNFLHFGIEIACTAALKINAKRYSIIKKAALDKQ